MANINNLFAGVFSFFLAMSMVYLFWQPVDDFIASIINTNAELGIFLEVCWIVLVVICTLVVPITLATSDDKGN